MKRFKTQWLSATQLQLAVLFTIAVIMSQAISLWIVHNQNIILQDAVDHFHILERNVSDVTLLNSLEPHQRAVAVTALSSGHRKNLLLADTAWKIPPQSNIPGLQQRLANNLNLPISKVFVSTKLLDQHICKDQYSPAPNNRPRPTPCESDLFLSVQLDDGEWLNFYFDLSPPSKLLIKKVTPGIILTIISIIIITSLTLNKITRPLKQLSIAAEKVGRGERCQIPASGPKDVKQTICAFNDMQENLNIYLKGRTYVMAAISHDLRTPITTMRLRVELLPESEDKLRLLQTLEEMQEITHASLDFFRETNIDEDNKDVDLNALLASICDDLQDTGLNVEYKNSARLIVSCRDKALKRALSNLIYNGAIYGQQAKVTIENTKKQIHINIDDQGEGIPLDMHERIFEPFVRLEHSRNNETGGTGLGLTIARTIIRHHGGDIKLLNKEKGFTVLVSFPIPS